MNDFLGIVLHRLQILCRDDPDTREVILKDLDELCERHLNNDFWGTEGQLDPRGDFRDSSEWSIDNVQPLQPSEFIKVYAENIAKHAHEVNRVFCEYNGDMSQPYWEDAPGWQKTSAINGVMHVAYQYPAFPDPAASHENWLKEKVADGWVYGEEKDPEQKTHPCICDYSALPAQQQVKDRFFGTVVYNEIDSLVKSFRGY